MSRYTTDLPCRSLSDGMEYENGFIENAKDAAKVFADRYARRVYGKRGYCHHVRQDTHTEDGRLFRYEAFIGVQDRTCGGTSGRNIWLSVTVEDRP